MKKNYSLASKNLVNTLVFILLYINLNISKNLA